jgi:hypothetical protein
MDQKSLFLNVIIGQSIKVFPSLCATRIFITVSSKAPLSLYRVICILPESIILFREDQF